MKIAILGATGCIGRSLIDKLLSLGGHEIIASYRKGSEPSEKEKENTVFWREIDLADDSSISEFLEGIDILYYLIHSFDSADFERLDREFAKNVQKALKHSEVKKVVYLGGIFPRNEKLSFHLASRRETGSILAASGIPIAEVRASIILGLCSDSFKIIYTVVKISPVIFAPKDIESLCSPVSIKDAIEFLSALAYIPLNDREVYEIGAQTLTYEELIKLCAEVIQKHKIIIIKIPLLFAHFFSFCLTALSDIKYRTAMNLTKSLTNNSSYINNRFKEIVGRDPEPLDSVFVGLADEIKKSG